MLRFFFQLHLSSEIEHFVFFAMKCSEMPRVSQWWDYYSYYRDPIETHREHKENLKIEEIAMVPAP